MILHDVPKGPHCFVEAPAPFDTEGLRHRDLDTRDVVAVPQRLEEGVREPEDEQVLDRLLSQEVIDAKDRRLRERLVQQEVERPSGSEIVSERFLHHHPCPPVEPGRAEAADDVVEHGWGDGEIEEGMASIPEPGREVAKRLRIAVVPAHIQESIGKAGECLIVDPVLRSLNGRTCVLSQPGVVPRRGGHADDRGLEASTGLDAVEGRKQLLSRQIAGRAEQDQRVGSSLTHLLVVRNQELSRAIAPLLSATVGRHGPFPGTRAGVGVRTVAVGESYSYRRPSPARSPRSATRTSWGSARKVRPPA